MLILKAFRFICYRICTALYSSNGCFFILIIKKHTLNIDCVNILKLILNLPPYYILYITYKILHLTILILLHLLLVLHRILLVINLIGFILILLLIRFRLLRYNLKFIESNFFYIFFRFNQVNIMKRNFVYAFFFFFKLIFF
jgi:hypothetical protein